MNFFEYKSTVITKSEFDLSKNKNDGRIVGSAEVSAAIGVPRDPEANPTVRCKAEMRITGEGETLQIYVQAISSFEIKVLDNPETLVDDAKGFCTPRTIEELSKKLDQLLSIQMGESVKIPIPPFSVK